MHHQRSACEASTSASIVQPSAGTKSGRREPHLDERADEQPGVQHHHHHEVPLAGLDAAAREAPRCVALRHHQLGEPLQPDGQDQDREPAS